MGTMIRDPVLRKIAEELSKDGLDPDSFERAATALLGEVYPDISPVSGGQDQGSDAVTSDPDSIFLASTTMADGEQNLRKSLRSHVKAGNASRRVIFATNRILNKKARNSLTAKAQKAGFQLVNIYDHSCFAPALVRSPFWRRELLNITGDALALSVIPPSRWPALVGPLVGRQEDLYALSPRQGDGVIVGVPGVGKTSLLRELAGAGWGYFLIRKDVGNVPDAVRELEPTRVIVDDAHSNPDILTELRQVREEMGTSFDIVGVTWPGRRAEEVSDRLQPKWKHDLHELERDELLEMLQALMPEGSDGLFAMIIDQAFGRPGLAAMLALLAINGNIRDVATGDALVTKTAVISSQLAGPASSSVRAVIALSGKSGVDLGSIAKILGRPLDDIKDIVDQLASGGMIAEPRGLMGFGRLILLPEALRYPVVKQMFFTGPAPLPIASAIKVLPDPGGAVLPLVGAAYRGASIPMDVFEVALGSAADSESWAVFGGQGKAEAAHAIERKPEYVIAIASAVVTKAPRFGFGILLAEASRTLAGDGMEDVIATKDALDEIKRWANDERLNLQMRKEIAASVREWRAEGGDSLVAVKALMLGLRTTIEGLGRGPGSPLKIKDRRSHYVEKGLEELSPIWDDFIEAAVDAGPPAYADVIETVTDWCYPGRFSRGQVDDETRQFARTRATEVIHEIASLISDHGGLRTKLKRLAEHAEIGVDVEEVLPFSCLFPDHEQRRDVDGREEEKENIDRAIVYAEGAIGDPTEAIREIAVAVREAGEVGERDTRFAFAAVSRLTEVSKNPQDLLIASTRCELHPDFLLPIAVACLRDEEGSDSVASLFEDEVYWRVAAAACLFRDVSDDLTERAVSLCDERVARALARNLARDEIAEDTVLKLLQHHNPAVAMEIAFAYRLSSFGMPERLVDAWETAISNAPLEEINHRFGLGQQPPHLVERWVHGWIERHATEQIQSELPRDVRQAIAGLEKDARLRLLREADEKKGAGFQSLVRTLVADDDELIGLLFELDGLKGYQWVALEREIDEKWLANACIAAQSGWSIDELVRTADRGWGSWDGSELEHWREVLDRVKALSPETLEAKSIVEAALVYCTGRQEQAVAAESRRSTRDYLDD